MVQLEKLIEAVNRGDLADVTNSLEGHRNSFTNGISRVLQPFTTRRSEVIDPLLNSSLNEAQISMPRMADLVQLQRVGRLNI